VAIHLSGLPGERPFSGTGRAARLPRLALLRVGFTEPAGSPPSLVRSYRTLSPLPVRARRPAIGGFLSVALSCGSPRLAVSQHPALWSPDLPRHVPVPRPPGRLTVTCDCATSGHVEVTGQRIGRVSSMSDGSTRGVVDGEPARRRNSDRPERPEHSAPQPCDRRLRLGAGAVPGIHCKNSVHQGTRHSEHDLVSHALR
jgi:hypothetical protein